MHRVVLIILGAALALAASTPGSADPKSPKLARCDGKARRPANPYGTILPSVDPAAGTMTPPAPGSGGIDVFPPAEPARPKPGGSPSTPPDGGTAPTPVPPIGAIDPSPQFRSC